jgi:hypothetical protein
MKLRIEGLVQTGPGEFELSGVVPRDIDWPAIMAALGGNATDEHADAIAEAIWDVDLRTILRERVKRF